MEILEHEHEHETTTALAIRLMREEWEAPLRLRIAELEAALAARDIDRAEHRIYQLVPDVTSDAQTILVPTLVIELAGDSWIDALNEYAGQRAHRIGQRSDGTWTLMGRPVFPSLSAAVRGLPQGQRWPPRRRRPAP